jgi:hypothetical protein
MLNYYLQHAYIHTQTNTIGAAASTIMQCVRQHNGIMVKVKTRHCAALC